MKITVTEEVVKEVEVATYYKTPLSHYKILNETDYLQVTRDGTNFGIKKESCLAMIQMLAVKGIPISEGEFKEALTLAFSHITLYVLQVKKDVEPATDFEIREKIEADVSEAVYEDD